MDLLQTVVLAIVQGLTEFLPISSSAHLILASDLTGWVDQGLGFDIAVHLGTLLAVVLYFHKTLGSMAKEWFTCGFSMNQTQDSKLAWYVIIGTIPVGIAGLLFKHEIEVYLRSPLVIAISTIVFGLLLGYASLVAKSDKREVDLNYLTVLIIGTAQAVALIPGTSRSGITITMALLLGFTATASARFSFLLSIPVIILAVLLQGLDILKDNVSIEVGYVLIGILISFISAILCIHFFLRLINVVGMMPFVVYRLALGIFLFIWLLM
ncbi:undecaprenyl-diphosphate phosphatase [Francisellaceae bacterium]|nr:undecaprenyl-diphosphate phosphatase [Francisellaceae bacterium]